MKRAHQEVVNCALAAAAEAASRYMEISGGKTIHDHAIETFISSKVAEAIYDKRKRHGGSVTLETSFGEIWEVSGARLGRGPADVTKRARFDVCYYEKGKPLAAIEVKKRFAAHKADRDIRKIEAAMRRLGPEFGGSLEFGIWLAVQRIGDKARTTAESQTNAFKEAFEWVTEPEVKCQTVRGEFGAFKRKLRSIVELRIFAVAFSIGG